MARFEPRRKTLARYGEAGPKRALCVEAGTKGQVISRTDSYRAGHHMSSSSFSSRANFSITASSSQVVRGIGFSARRAATNLSTRASTPLGIRSDTGASSASAATPPVRPAVEPPFLAGIRGFPAAAGFGRRVASLPLVGILRFPSQL
jgi:hypothetical protein